MCGCQLYYGKPEKSADILSPRVGKVSNLASLECLINSKLYHSY